MPAPSAGEIFAVEALFKAGLEAAALPAMEPAPLPEMRTKPAVKGQYAGLFTKYGDEELGLADEGYESEQQRKSGSSGKERSYRKTEKAQNTDLKPSSKTRPTNNQLL